jgi:hypothetical protein
MSARDTTRNTTDTVYFQDKTKQDKSVNSITEKIHSKIYKLGLQNQKLGRK